jgi:hypothetical protein
MRASPVKDLEPVARKDALAHADVERREGKSLGHRLADTELLGRSGCGACKNERDRDGICKRGREREHK